MTELDEATQHKTITWVDPRPQAAEALTMSGIDYLQAMIDGTFPAPPIAGHINLELASVAPGVATMRVRSTPSQSAERRCDRTGSRKSSPLRRVPPWTTAASALASVDFPEPPYPLIATTVRGRVSRRFSIRAARSSNVTCGTVSRAAGGIALCRSRSTPCATAAPGSRSQSRG